MVILVHLALLVRELVPSVIEQKHQNTFPPQFISIKVGILFDLEFIAYFEGFSGHTFFFHCILLFGEYI